MSETHDELPIIGELYDHRAALFIALCRLLKERGHDVWRARHQNDGYGYVSRFLMGVGSEAGEQISYHLSLKHWSQTDFAATYDRVPYGWDGHTPEDVLVRLYAL